MINVSGLTKSYGKLTAVNNINIEAKDGEITVLLGPNGAGKSTTIKSICGLLDFKGNIYINEYSNKTLEAKRTFGYIPEVAVLYDLLTIKEHIDFIGKAYRAEGYQAIADKYIKLFKLEDKVNVVAKNLSKGMKQKLSIILGLIMNPKAVLIDEPMIGLDPSSIEEVLTLLKQLKNDGVALLISTHIIDIVDQIWDRAYIMNKGIIVREVRRNELKNETLKQLFFECTKETENEEINKDLNDEEQIHE
ncbi:MAG: ABC transporter ATP-binding protein [Erysipelotrichaceae bacterium]